LDLSSSFYSGIATSLIDVPWQIQIDRSNELPILLESAQANNWQSFMTLDESWFYLWASHEKSCVQAGQQPPERVKHMISQSTHYGRFSPIGLNG
jgi:hypothetical protein